MSPTRFSFTKETLRDDRVVRFFGAADLVSVPVLQDLFRRLEREQFRALLIDLSATEFINSPVWAVITLFSKKRKNTSSIVIVGMPDPIQGSFEMMGLDRVFVSFPTLQAAQAALDQ